MSSKVLIGIIGAVLVFGIFFFLNSKGGITTDAVKESKITVYKSMTCGCCGNYANYLKNLKLNVDIVDVTDVSSTKTKYNIPQAVQSCHTSVFGKYFVEGHIPIEAVNKLLEEQPDIDGIAMPGMPSGSPGMPGSKSPFVIYSVKDGKFEKYMEL